MKKTMLIALAILVTGCASSPHQDKCRSFGAYDWSPEKKECVPDLRSAAATCSSAGRSRGCAL